MQKLFKRFILAVLFVSLGWIGTQPSVAGSPPRPLSETHKAINETIKSSWSSSKKIAGKHTDISFGIADDGKIYEPVVKTFSGDDQYDAECLEAICSMSPVVPPPQAHSGFLHHFSFNFGSGSDLEPKFDGKEVNSYLVANPEPKEVSYPLGQVPFVLVHKIPLTVLTRYPGMFTEAELTNQNNLVKVNFMPVAEKSVDIQPSYVGRIAALYAGWNEIFKQGNVTKSKISERAKQIPLILD